MPLENDEGEDLQLSGSTFTGNITVVGGVYYGSGNVGSLPAYVQSLRVDPSGSIFVTASGSLPVHLDAPVQATIAGQIGVNNFPAYQAVSGSVNTYTSGLQGVSGTVQVWSEGALPISGAVALTNWPATLGVSSSSPLQVYSSGTLGVSGSVALTNWPSVVGVSSSSPSGFWFGGAAGVTGSVNTYTSGPQAVSGTVQVWTEGAFPVSGTVTALIGNWPATIGVSSSSPLQVYSSGTLGVSGSVALTNWPAIHGVSSSSPSGFWTSGIAGVSGSVNTYTSGLQGVSGTVQIWSEGPIPVSGSVQVTGSVALTNWPAVHGVSSSSPSGFWATGPMAVTGSQLSGSTFVGYPVVIGGVDSGYVRGLHVDSNGDLYITTSSSGSITVTVQGQAPSGSTQSGNPVTVSGVDSTGVVRALDVDSLGRIVIAPAGTGVTNGFAYGTVTTTATTNVALRASTYNEPTGSAQRSISSANAADTLAGTGAQKVTITYYDNNYNGPFTETIALSGSTWNNTVNTNICFIEKMVVTQVGTGGNNAGVITLNVGIAGNNSTLATMNATDNQTFWAHHYTPAGKTSYVTGITGNNNNGSNETLFEIKAKASGSNQPELVLSDTFQCPPAGGSTVRTFGTPLKQAGGARLLMYAAPGGTPTIINRGSFDFYDQ